MIRKEDLLEIGKFRGLQPRFAELDYLQDVALLNIAGEFGNMLVLKGGTGMYKAYKLNRFSEDLDFTAMKGFRPRDFFQRLPYFFRLLDINSHVKVEQFGNSINAYLEANGPLYDGGKESRTSVVFNISLKERVLLAPVRHPYMPPYPELRPFDLFVMDEREILAEKVRAIFEREKARDVYDLWYLLKRRGIRFDARLVDKKLPTGMKFGRQGLFAKIEEKRKGWERDLGALVGGELPPLDGVKKEIGEFISGVIV